MTPLSRANGATPARLAAALPSMRPSSGISASRLTGGQPADPGGRGPRGPRAAAAVRRRPAGPRSRRRAARSRPPARRDARPGDVISSGFVDPACPAGALPSRIVTSCATAQHQRRQGIVDRRPRCPWRRLDALGEQRRAHRASMRSVLARSPQALAKSRPCRGLSQSHRQLRRGRKRTHQFVLQPTRRLDDHKGRSWLAIQATSRPMPRPGHARTRRQAPPGRRCTSSRPSLTSMPTNVLKSPRLILDPPSSYAGLPPGRLFGFYEAYRRARAGPAICHDQGLSGVPPADRPRQLPATITSPRQSSQSPILGRYEDAFLLVSRLLAGGRHSLTLLPPRRRGICPRVMAV